MAARQRRRVLLLLRRLAQLARVRGLDNNSGAIVGEAVGCDAQGADLGSLLADAVVSDGIERQAVSCKADDIEATWLEALICCNPNRFSGSGGNMRTR